MSHNEVLLYKFLLKSKYYSNFDLPYWIRHLNFENLKEYSDSVTMKSFRLEFPCSSENFSDTFFFVPNYFSLHCEGVSYPRLPTP